MIIYEKGGKNTLTVTKSQFIYYYLITKMNQKLLVDNLSLGVRFLALTTMFQSFIVLAFFNLKICLLAVPPTAIYTNNII